MKSRYCLLRLFPSEFLPVPARFLSASSNATTAVVIHKEPISWVRKGGVTPDFEPGHKMRPVAYSERRLKRETTFPDSPINDVFLNFYMGKCVYDHCFPYHILTKDQYASFMDRINRMSKSMEINNLGSNSSNDEVLRSLRKAGMFGIRTKPTLGGLGVSFERELLRFSECILDYTQNSVLIKHVITQNIIQMCVNKYVYHSEVSNNLQTLLNEEISAQFIIFDGGKVEKFEGRYTISCGQRLKTYGALNNHELSDLLLCVMKNGQTNTLFSFLVPTKDKEGLSYNPETQELKFENCLISSELIIENGNDVVEMFDSLYSLCIGAVVSKWAKMLANDVFLDLSRRRRHGYRMIKYQNIMNQIEELETLCYVIETLPYFSASRMDRARERFKHEPPRMISEIRSSQLNQQHYVHKFIEKLQILVGPELLNNESFINFEDFVNDAYPNSDELSSQISKEGINLFAESLSDKTLQFTKTQKVRQFYFNNIIHLTSNCVQGMLSDPSLVFVHHNYTNLANSIDGMTYRSLKVMQKAAKERSETFRDDPFFNKVVREFALGMHVVIAVIARASQSTFVGSPHYHHENRFVEKFVNDKLQEIAYGLQNWDRPGAFEASSLVAEHAIESEEDLHDVLSWTRVKKLENDSDHEVKL